MSRIDAVSPQKGNVARATTRPAPTTAKRRLALVLRSTVKSEAIASSVSRAWEEAVGAQHQHHEECQMARQNLPLRIEDGADRLCDPEDYRAEQRPPEIAEPADDDRLEGVDQPVGSDRRVEVAADREKDAGDGGHREGDRHRQRIEMPVVDAHQPRRHRIVRGGAEGAAEIAAEEQE